MTIETFIHFHDEDVKVKLEGRLTLGSNKYDDPPYVRIDDVIRNDNKFSILSSLGDNQVEALEHELYTAFLKTKTK